MVSGYPAGSSSGRDWRALAFVLDSDRLGYTGLRFEVRRKHGNPRREDELPAPIDALQQLLSDKGTNASDVGSLKRGTFYFGSAPDKPRKVATSLCLSYHPSTPPSETEVLESAKRSAKLLSGTG